MKPIQIKDFILYANPLKTPLGPSLNDGRNPVGAFNNGLVDPKKVTPQADPDLGRACYQQLPAVNSKSLL